MSGTASPRLGADDAKTVGAAELSVGARRVPSAALFGCDREIVILHRGQEYRLRITKADKLILTK